MSEFKLEDGIPAPSKGRGRGTKYPFSAMEVGQSFFVPTPSRENARTVQAYVQISGKGYANRHGGGTMVFTTSVREEDGVVGVRVWRVK